MAAIESRNARGHFIPGRSGNPKGRRPRSKQQISVENAARVYTQEALDTLVKHMRGDDPRVFVQAANAILDRGHGKPMQSLSGRIEHLDLGQAHLKALQQRLSRRGVVTDVPADLPLLETQPVKQVAC